MGHSKPASWHPSAIGTLTRLAYAHAKTNELDLKPLLKRANLRIGQINSPDARLRASNQIRFLSLIADALRDDLLGFHLAQLIDLRELGFLYYISASSQTLGDALSRLARYTSIANEGVLLKQTFQGSVRTEFNYVGVSRHLDRHQMDFFVTVLVRLCRHLIDRRIPARVRLAHSAPSGCRKLIEFFGSEIEFNAPVDDVSFDKTVKDMRIASEDPYLNRFLTDYCEQALSNRITPRSALRTDIENEIVKLLPHGQAAFGVVALRLA